ncbi:hypothetical protein BGZ61DRAFT_116480 [Ilyonectria robusta]|uniref:uncharacterized protein n=1 Tax=Ilyonectria robusta TaxID=1079257 RepID=UPI001E8D90DB|nr:uncharacterized protein BGZ61DRAFT_116480 [Ilyonectria robusta]KAH8669307.1 hypothetical protein BGZ61DRAFT_116480 [Ilyonectria robusta]
MQLLTLCKNGLRSDDTRVADITKSLFGYCTPNKLAMLARVLSPGIGRVFVASSRVRLGIAGGAQELVHTSGARASGLGGNDPSHQGGEASSRNQALPIVSMRTFVLATGTHIKVVSLSCFMWACVPSTVALHFVQACLHPALSRFGRNGFFTHHQAGQTCIRLQASQVKNSL